MSHPLWKKIEDWYYRHGFYGVYYEMRWVKMYRDPEVLWNELKGL